MGFVIHRSLGRVGHIRQPVLVPFGPLSVASFHSAHGFPIPLKAGREGYDVHRALWQPGRADDAPRSFVGPPRPAEHPFPGGSGSPTSSPDTVDASPE